MAKYKWDNLILFVEQLGTATKLQLPLDKTIASLSRESFDTKWSKAQDSVSELVRMGSPLSEAMDHYPQYFPGMMRRLIRVGEEGQVLPAMLASLSRYIQSAREIQHRLQKCMIYPIMVWTLLLINMALLGIFVIPKFYAIFEGLGAGFNSFSLRSISPFWILSVGPSALIVGEGLFLFLAWIVIGWLSADLEGRSYTSYWVNRIVPFLPFIGNMYRHSRSAELCEVLGILVEGGNPMRDAIRIARGVMDDHPMQRALEEVDTALVSGMPFESVPAQSLIPSTSLWMMVETGGHPELGKALQEIAQYHRRQVDLLSSTLREFIEPILIFSIAVFGGLTIIGFYSLLFQISGGFLQSFLM